MATSFSELTDPADDGAVPEPVAEARALRDQLLYDAGIGVWRYDPDADVFHFSPELLRGAEAPAAGVPKAYVDALVHPDDLLVEQAIRERITSEGGVGEMELRMRDTPAGAGEWRHMHIRLRAGKQLPSGRYEMYGLTQAVTELAQARDKARANAEHLQMALVSAKAGAFEMDFDRSELIGSPEFNALAGRVITFSEIVSQGLLGLHPDNPPIALFLAGAVPDSQAYETIDFRVIRAEGERWMRICCDIQRHPDQRPKRVVGLMFDIDDSKRQELAFVEAQHAAEEATLAKSAFLASVSHEIRTPMNGITGVLHLLKAEALSDDGRRLLEEALACSGMLAQLVDDVLDFSKIEAGKLELAPEPTEIGATVRGVVELLRPLADAAGLYLRYSIDPNVGWGNVDPVRLRQCLFNLVGNAIKFTRVGGVEIRVARAALDRVRVEVEDTGIGIPDGAKARMFDRFEQADHDSTRNIRGTGLGLSIARSLAQLMGGDVGFESEENRGSTFWLEALAPAIAAPQPATEAAGANLGGVRVLVVDDNPTNRLVASKIIEALGAEATACEDGESAIAAAKSEAFDLVLMDVNMPGMDGLEATRRLRALGGHWARAPVIALTANVMAHQRQAYLAAGMDGMVAKPFSPNALLSEMSRLLAEQPDGQAGIRTGIAS
ncbi:MAG TPA: ATP-binding protein [Caulobacteraceae bacterium]|nr:ATP-binding protein [Caulobacteraceae bacterium]